MVTKGVHAQNDEDKVDSSDFSIKDLQGTIWQMIGKDDKAYILEFTGNRIIHYLNGVQIAVIEYYLSNEVEEIFDKKKLGKNTFGKYIVNKTNKVNEKNGVGFVDIITELNKQNLTMESVDGKKKAKFRRVQE